MDYEKIQEKHKYLLQVMVCIEHSENAGFS